MAELLRPSDVAQILNVSVRQVQQMASVGNLPGNISATGDWSFDPTAVRRWIKRAAHATPASIARTEQTSRIERERKLSDVIKQEMPGPKAIISGASAWPSAGTGIYFLIHGEAVVYVGQAIDVVARIAAHSATKKFDRWNWIPCKRSDLDRTERVYINALLPKLNRDAITRKLRSSKAVEVAETAL